jgi:hypothetical protein
VFHVPVRLTSIVSCQICGGDLVPPACDENGRVGHHDVETAEFGYSLGRDLLQAFEVAGVDLPGDDTPVEGLHLLYRLGEVVGCRRVVENTSHWLADIDGDDVGTFLRKPQCVAAALAPGGAGNEGDLPRDAIRHGSSPGLSGFAEKGRRVRSGG